MFVSFVSVLSFLVMLSMMLVIVPMCFQGLLGAVDAVSIWNEYLWSASNLDHMSG